MNKTKEELLAARSFSDGEVIKQILQGKKQLLEILYDRYATKVFHKCLSITKDRHVSEDLSHDIMVKVFLKLNSFKGTSDFSFWVYSITYNHCMDYLKKKKRLRFDDFEDMAYAHVDTADIELEHKVLKELQLEQLTILFEELKPADKMILLMRYQDGMSIKEMVATLQLGESAIKMRLKRSRERLAELLKAVHHEE